ncbi:acyl carrier protein [Rubrimonas cliftonensis]|uniref:Acyl carrier protein AcpXL n=1 Tax=Rubrimonas cliftonensis TaxID=89524 RepID=A0A1H3ZBF1_9RHOB|nr:phosphopantetheine-binding protein [Rubrimonas cliftonensis]SEA20662.1 acyl carrier protein [Rubrimonas cliftonensis]
MTDDVARKIIAIIAEQAMLEPHEVTLDASPEQLGVDSLGLVEIVFAIEEAFDISIPYNANDPAASEFDISSVDKIVEAVRRLITEQA